MTKIEFNLVLTLCIYSFFTRYYYSADATAILSGYKYVQVQGFLKNLDELAVDINLLCTLFQDEKEKLLTELGMLYQRKSEYAFEIEMELINNLERILKNNEQLHLHKLKNKKIELIDNLVKKQQIQEKKMKLVENLEKKQQHLQQLHLQQKQLQGLLLLQDNPFELRHTMIQIMGDLDEFIEEILKIRSHFQDQRRLFEQTIKDEKIKLESVVEYTIKKRNTFGSDIITKIQDLIQKVHERLLEQLQKTLKLPELQLQSNNKNDEKQNILITEINDENELKKETTETKETTPTQQNNNTEPGTFTTAIPQNISTGETSENNQSIPNASLTTIPLNNDAENDKNKQNISDATTFENDYTENDGATTEIPNDSENEFTAETPEENNESTVPIFMILWNKVKAIILFIFKPILYIFNLIFCRKDNKLSNE